MRFFQAIFLGVFLLSSAEGKEPFHVKGPFDLDKDKASECLILNSRDHSILFVEINFSGENDTLWSYKFENEISIADGNFIDKGEPEHSSEDIKINYNYESDD